MLQKKNIRGYNPHCEYIKQLTIQQNNHATKLNTKFNVFVRKS